MWHAAHAAPHVHAAVALPHGAARPHDYLSREKKEAPGPAAETAPETAPGPAPETAAETAAAHGPVALAQLSLANALAQHRRADFAPVSPRCPVYRAALALGASADVAVAGADFYQRAVIAADGLPWTSAWQRLVAQSLERALRPDWHPAEFAARPVRTCATAVYAVCVHLAMKVETARAHSWSLAALLVAVGLPADTLGSEALVDVETWVLRRLRYRLIAATG